MGILTKIGKEIYKQTKKGIHHALKKTPYEKWRNKLTTKQFLQILLDTIDEPQQIEDILIDYYNNTIDPIGDK